MASGEANNPWLHAGAAPTGSDGTSGPADGSAQPSSGMATVLPSSEGSNIFQRAQGVLPSPLTDGTTINTDASQSNTFYVTLGGNRTLANPTNLINGFIYNWRIKQDGTGNRTLAYGSKFKWPGGTAPTLSTAAGAVDMITAQYWSDSDTLLANCLKGFA